MRWQAIYTGIMISIVSGLAITTVMLTGRVYAQSQEAELTFTPAQVAVEAGQTGTVSLGISGEDGISGFLVVLDAENATIEEINDSITVSGGDAEASDFSRVVEFINEDKTQAKISYVTVSLSDNELPTTITVSVEAKPAGSATGTIQASSDSDAEVTGGGGQTYTLNPTNEATISINADEPAPTNAPGGGTCQSYWIIGDANCSGGKPDRNDFEIWKIAYVPLTGGPASIQACVEAGNIKADFNNDNVVNLKDFEIWRRGKYGTTTNPQKQWPAECVE